MGSQSRSDPKKPVAPAPGTLSVVPIGVVHSPFKNKRSAPRQAPLARDVRATIELYPDPRYQHALADIESWSHLWVLFWFHLNEGWTAKVRPPRSVVRRGLFATRAPHRPNPIGLTVVKLEGVSGRTLEVSGVDIVDGSPVVDIKPYVPYADIVVEAGSGWLSDTPDLALDVGPRYEVTWTPHALAQLEWLEREHGVTLQKDAEATLALGPTPHPYRRIKQEGEHFRLALRDFRVLFTLADRTVTVFELRSGYRARDLKDPHAEAKGDTPLAVHRAFAKRFKPVVP